MRTTRPIRHVALAALICCAALATTASGAVARATRQTANRPLAHAAAADCLWENATAKPVLYTRAYPSLDGKVLPYTVSLGGHFYGSKRGHFNDDVYWVQLDVGGWANASYLVWIPGGSQSKSYCMS